jgi:ribosomal protein S18 acetylase RimI-like enzyme
MWRETVRRGAGTRIDAYSERAMIEYRDTSDQVDLLQLARLFDSVGWHYRTGDAERLAQMVRGSAYATSALDGHKLVGFARAISDGAFNAYVSTVAVLPAYQRQGIGRELIRRLLKGRDHLLFVLHAAADVHPFYLRCGFHPASDMLRRDRSH